MTAEEAEEVAMKLRAKDREIMDLGQLCEIMRAKIKELEKKNVR